MCVCMETCSYSVLPTYLPTYLRIYIHTYLFIRSMVYFYQQIDMKMYTDMAVACRGRGSCALNRSVGPFRLRTSGRTHWPCYSGWSWRLDSRAWAYQIVKGASKYWHGRTSQDKLKAAQGFLFTGLADFVWIGRFCGQDSSHSASSTFDGLHSPFSPSKAFRL